MYLISVGGYITHENTDEGENMRFLKTKEETSFKSSLLIHLSRNPILLLVGTSRKGKEDI